MSRKAISQVMCTDGRCVVADNILLTSCIELMIIRHLDMRRMGASAIDYVELIYADAIHRLLIPCF